MVGVAVRLEVCGVEMLDEPVGEEAEVVGDSRHDPAQVTSQKAAVIEGFHVGKRVDIVLRKVGDAVQDRSAHRRRGRRPAGTGSVCGLNGQLHLGEDAARDLPERRAIDRRAVGEGGIGCPARAADVVARIDSDARDFDSARHRAERHRAERHRTEIHRAEIHRAWRHTTGRHGIRRHALGAFPLISSRVG